MHPSDRYSVQYLLLFLGHDMQSFCSLWPPQRSKLRINFVPEVVFTDTDETKQCKQEQLQDEQLHDNTATETGLGSVAQSVQNWQRGRHNCTIRSEHFWDRIYGRIDGHTVLKYTEYGQKRPILAQNTEYTTEYSPYAEWPNPYGATLVGSTPLGRAPSGRTRQ